MKKNSLLWSIMTMLRAENTGEGEREFFHAFNIFEKKFERGIFFILAVLGTAFFASAFIEFRGMFDFLFRTALGLFLMFFSAWSIRQKK